MCSVAKGEWRDELELRIQEKYYEWLKMEADDFNYRYDTVLSYKCQT